MSSGHKKFYGSVTVSERGQVVIPAAARRDFNIAPGDKLLVLGDLDQGLAFATLDMMAKTMEGARELFSEVERIKDCGEAGDRRDAPPQPKRS